MIFFLGNSFEYYMSFLNPIMYTCVYSKIYSPLFRNRHVIFKNAGYTVFSDGSYIHNFEFIDECDKQSLNWLDEMERLYPLEYLGRNEKT